jgi:hypothetical protein
VNWVLSRPRFGVQSTRRLLADCSSVRYLGGITECNSLGFLSGHHNAGEIWRSLLPEPQALIDSPFGQRTGYLGQRTGLSGKRQTRFGQKTDNEKAADIFLPVER